MTICIICTFILSVFLGKEALVDIIYQIQFFHHLWKEKGTLIVAVHSMEHSIEGGMMGVDRFCISPVLHRSFKLSSIKT